MCSQHTEKKKRSFNTSLFYFAAIALGIFSGLSDIAYFQNFGLLISDLFIKVFKSISLPIIALSIIVTLCNYNANAGMRNIWRRTISYTLSTTIIAAAVSCGLYLLI